MYLTGAKPVSMDAQGRITLPSDVRDELRAAAAEEQGCSEADGSKKAPVVKVCLIPLHGALWGFTPAGHREYVAKCFSDANGFSNRSVSADKLRRALTARTVTIELDKSGRLALSKLSAATLEKLGIEHDVYVVGNDDHLEIWAASAWADVADELSDEELDAMLFNEE